MSETRSKRDFPSAAHVTLLGAVLYATGFLVANSHFGRFLPFQSSVLSSRYLAAAAWLLLWNLFPLVTTLTALDAAVARRKRADLPEPGEEAVLVDLPDLIRALPDYAWVLLLALILQTGSLDRLLVVGPPGSYLTALGSFIGSCLILFPFLRVLYPIVPSKSRGTERGRAAGLSLWAAWVVIPYVGLAITFGSMIYPEITPALGGGAGWLARVTIQAPRDSTPTIGTGTHQVVLVDLAPDFAYFMTCDATLKRPTPVAVPRTNIVQVTLVEQMRMSDGGLRRAICSP